MNRLLRSSILAGAVAAVALAYIVLGSIPHAHAANCGYPTSTIGALTAGCQLVVFQSKMTGSAIQLPSNALNNGMVCIAKAGNAASVEFGGSGVTATVDGTGNGLIVAAGSSASFAVNNSNLVYAIGTNNDVISCSGN